MKLSAKQQENLLVMISQFLDRVENETRSMINAGYAARDVPFVINSISKSFISEKVWIKNRLFEWELD